MADGVCRRRLRLLIWIVSIATLSTRICGVGYGIVVVGLSLLWGLPVCGAFGALFAALVPNVSERFESGLKTRILAMVVPLALALARWVRTSNAHDPCHLF